MSGEFDVVGHLTFRLHDGEEQTRAGRRQSFRAHIPGMQAHIHGMLDSFAVNDISAGGVCVAMPAHLFAKGDTFTLDILIAGQCYISNVTAVVVRLMEGECACAFQDLSRHHELKLDKLVLEMQKRSIAQRKKEREAADAAAAQEAAREQAENGPAEEPPSIHLA